MVHAEHADEPSGELRLEHLPPIADAPILDILKQVGIEDFRENHAIETPVYSNGLINHHALIETVKGLVSPEHRWQSPFFDEHHIYYPKADYVLPTISLENGGSESLLIRGGNRHRYVDFFRDEEPTYEYLNSHEFLELLHMVQYEEFYDDAPGMSVNNSIEHYKITEEFREHASNKLFVPRGFHDFLHVVMRKADLPDFAVMKQEVRDHRRREYLYQIATNAQVIRERLDRAVAVPLPKGGSLLMDLEKRKTVHNPDDLEKRRQLFIQQIMKHHRMGLIDLTRLAPLEVVERQSVERSLGLIALNIRDDNQDYVRTRHGRRARKVPLSTVYVESSDRRALRKPAA